MQQFGGNCHDNICVICMQELKSLDDDGLVRIPFTSTGIGASTEENCFHVECLKLWVSHSLAKNRYPTNPMNNNPLPRNLVRAIAGEDFRLPLTRKSVPPDIVLPEIEPGLIEVSRDDEDLPGAFQDHEYQDSEYTDESEPEPDTGSDTSSDTGISAIQEQEEEPRQRLDEEHAESRGRYEMQILPQ